MKASCLVDVEPFCRSLTGSVKPEGPSTAKSCWRSEVPHADPVELRQVQVNSAEFEKLFLDSLKQAGGAAESEGEAPEFLLV